MLVHTVKSMMAVPLNVEIHEGVVLSNRDKRTLFNKDATLVFGLQVAEPCYVVALSGCTSDKLVDGLLSQKHDLVTRCRCPITSPIIAHLNL